MVDQASFLTKYPEFVNDLGLIPDALANALLLVGAAEWGTLFEAGTFALTAHYISQRKTELAAGASGASLEALVASKSADGVSVSFATPSSGFSLDDLSFSSTTYGLRYLQLRRGAGVSCLAI